MWKSIDILREIRWIKIHVIFCLIIVFGIELINGDHLYGNFRMISVILFY